MRIYVAVRDRDWNTVPCVLTQTEEQINEDSFDIDFEMEHKTDDIHFVWRGALCGDSEGKITFSFDGEARKTFERNRIGFCLLFPAQFAGMKCSIHRIDRSENEAVFPLSISPDQPVVPFDEMR